MKKFLIIGLGLMGGSLAKSLRGLDFVGQIYGFDLDTISLDKAKKSAIIDEGLDLTDAKLSECDLIALCCPLFAYEENLQKISATLKNSNKKPIIFDLGSLKSFIFDEIPENLQEKFIACHPIAGSDKSGLEAADEKLFFGKKVIICKNGLNQKNDVDFVANLFEKLGSKPEFLNAKQHDKIYALMSHLPQFLSFLTKEFSPKTNDKAFRLNNSNEKIWGEIFALNEENIQKFYEEFFDNLMDFAKDLDDNKFDEISQKLTKIAQILPKNDEKSLKMAKNDENLKKILFRLIIVAAYVKIKNVQEFLNYAGTGFSDFVSIVNLAEDANLAQFLKEERENILGFIDEIS